MARLVRLHAYALHLNTRSFLCRYVAHSFISIPGDGESVACTNVPSRDDCETGGKCAAWGAPFISISAAATTNFDDATCIVGAAAAPCDSSPVNSGDASNSTPHHRRLCVCLAERRVQRIGEDRVPFVRVSRSDPDPASTAAVDGMVGVDAWVVGGSYAPDDDVDDDDGYDYAYDYDYDDPDDSNPGMYSNPSGATAHQPLAWKAIMKGHAEEDDSTIAANVGIYIGVAVALGVVLLMAIAGYAYYKKKLNTARIEIMHDAHIPDGGAFDFNEQLKGMITNGEIERTPTGMRTRKGSRLVEEMVVEEIPRHLVAIGRRIGGGNFGDVHVGTLSQKPIFNSRTSTAKHVIKFDIAIKKVKEGGRRQVKHVVHVSP